MRGFRLAGESPTPRFPSIVNPRKLETGLRTNSAGIPYTLLLRIEAIGFPTFLASAVVPFCPFYCGGVSLLKPNIRKKGTLIIRGLLRNLDTLLSRGLAASAEAAAEAHVLL